MKYLLLIAILTVPLSIAASSVESASQSDDPGIRAGHNIAMTTCVACHVVSPDQSIKPVLGPGIPSFQEIANRPDATVDSLRTAMKVARWHDPGMAATLLPMSRITDAERAQVARYILSLRAQR